MNRSMKYTKIIHFFFSWNNLILKNLLRLYLMIQFVNSFWLFDYYWIPFEKIWFNKFYKNKLLWNIYSELHKGMTKNLHTISNRVSAKEWKKNDKRWLGWHLYFYFKSLLGSEVSSLYKQFDFSLSLETIIPSNLRWNYPWIFTNVVFMWFSSNLI